MPLKIIIFGVLLLHMCYARKHHLEIRDDYRRYIALSTFGFYEHGELDVKFQNFEVENARFDGVFGLSLDKTMTDAMNPYLDSHQDRCILDDKATSSNHGPIIFFVMDLKNHKVHVNCSPDWPKVHIYEKKTEHPNPQPYESIIYAPQRRKRDTYPKCNVELPMTSVELTPGIRTYSLSFIMTVPTMGEEGLYNLYFHACPNYKEPPFSLNFDVDIEERNGGNYLSAGEMPLPALYIMMSILFFLSGLFWVFILRKSKHTVFKIHYIMAVLVFLKSLSLMFHSINFHFIEVRGEHVEAWAILFYITHLLKGAVLFITIVLIGTGWTFVKQILADKDKKLFMIVIPLQVLANVAEIIIAESEEGDKEHRTWRDIFILVDLLCCGAILFPVVWSIRHLQEASATDGKAAINLRKLKLFRQFYIMIVCYIYFTRIIVYLLKITVPFQYGWLDEMFKEMATYVFFVLTGYKFRPASSHPYFAVDTDDDDSEVEVLTQSGFTEGIHKTKAVNRSLPQPATATVLVVDANEDERETLIGKRESSHEYD